MRNPVKHRRDHCRGNFSTKWLRLLASHSKASLIPSFTLWRYHLTDLVQKKLDYAPRFLQSHQDNVIIHSALARTFEHPPSSRFANISLDWKSTTNIGLSRRCKWSELFHVSSSSPVTGQYEAPGLFWSKDGFQVEAMATQLWYVNCHSSRFPNMTKESRLSLRNCQSFREAVFTWKTVFKLYPTFSVLHCTSRTFSKCQTSIPIKPHCPGVFVISVKLIKRSECGL